MHLLPRKNQSQFNHLNNFLPLREIVQFVQFNYLQMVKNIWKSYIWTADKDVNESDPRSNVHYLGSSENRAWKNSGLYGIWTHDLCDTGAALYQLS